MKTISIPYYTSTLDLHVDEANLKAVVTAKMHEYKAGKTEVELVHEALEHPIASPRHFYPRSPCGERLPYQRQIDQKSNFYPRSPCGERPCPSPC